jgi:hypothetical protein
MGNLKIFMQKNYCIICSFTEDADELALKVQDLVTSGWLTSGGLAASGSKLYQALKKK